MEDVPRAKLRVFSHFIEISKYAPITSIGSWDSLLVKWWSHDRKLVSLNPGRSSGRIFFSRVNFVCWLLFVVCSFPRLWQWHVKDPGHSAKSTGGRLLLNMHTPLTQWSQSWADYAFVGNTWPQSSQLAERLWTDPGLKSGISVHKLISTEKKKKRRWGMNGHTSCQNPLTRAKYHHHHLHGDWIALCCRSLLFLRKAARIFPHVSVTRNMKNFVDSFKPSWSRSPKWMETFGARTTCTGSKPRCCWMRRQS